MGFFSSFGSKISSGVQSLGQKASSNVKAGRKLVHDHAKQIENIAKTTGDIAGFVGNVATAALPFAAYIPIGGEVIAGLAAGGKAIEAGSRYVQKGAAAAGAAETALSTAEAGWTSGKDAITELRKGNIISAVKDAEEAGKQASSLKKQIERRRNP